jgi:hypothetical protein
MPLVPADRCMGLNDTDTPVAYTTPVFANYNGYGAEVRYVGDLTGVITIPAIAGLCRLTQWTVFGPASAGVRDVRATAMFLETALGPTRHIAPLRAQSQGYAPNANRNCRKS